MKNEIFVLRLDLDGGVEPWGCWGEVPGENLHKIGPNKFMAGGLCGEGGEGCVSYKYAFFTSTYFFCLKIIAILR